MTLYVSPSGLPTHGDTSCTDAKYTSIQAAVTAAHSGDTVFVCAGTYNEQVSVSTSHLTLTGAGSSSIIKPSSASPSNVTDPDNGQSTVYIIDVAAGTTDLTISSLVVDGSGLQSSFSWPGCSDDLIGVFYQAASGAVSGATVQNIELPSGLGGCQDGLSVAVEAHTGRAEVTLQNDVINGYDKGGIACADSGTTCHVLNDQVTGLGPSLAGAANGVQIGFGSGGEVTNNTIKANDWTGTSTEPEPQADYAAGILLYAASGNTQVHDNTLTDNQIAVEVVHSDGHLEHNTISEGAGITNSVGVFSVPCDIYCSYFSLSGGSEQVVANNNQISFPGSTAGTTGIWVGDVAASSTGTVQVNANQNHISGAVNDIVLGPTATGQVNTP